VQSLILSSLAAGFDPTFPNHAGLGSEKGPYPFFA